ncbi:MAG: TolC family outer membrane protein [Hydrogenovibrio sp.]
MNKNNLKIKALSAISVVWLTFSSQPSQAMDIKEAIEDAIIHNPEFRQQVKGYRAIEAEVRGAQSGYYPKLDILAGYGYEEIDKPGLNNQGDGLMRREAQILLTQNLFEGFGTQDEVARQKYRLDAQAYQAITTANDIALEMAQAYVNLLKEQELLKLAQDNLDTHIKLYDQIKKRTEAGIGNQVEVDQAEARLALAQSNVGAAENNYFDARAKFWRVLGRQPENDLLKPQFTAKLPKSVDEATNIALADHPTLKSAQADIAEARMQYEASAKNYYPKIDLEVGQRLDHNIDGIEGENNNLQAMVVMSYNLYNGGRDAATRKQTSSQYHQATEIRNNTRRQVIENLRYAWNANEFIGSQLEYVNQHIKLTHETLLGYRKQFSLGRRSLLDLLNTENEYMSAIRTLITNEAEQLNAKYRILAGMGHLLPELGIEYSFIAAEEEHTEE